MDDEALPPRRVGRRRDTLVLIALATAARRRGGDGSKRRLAGQPPIPRGRDHKGQGSDQRRSPRPGRRLSSRRPRRLDQAKRPRRRPGPGRRRAQNTLASPAADRTTPEPMAVAAPVTPIVADKCNPAAREGGSPRAPPGVGGVEDSHRDPSAPTGDQPTRPRMGRRTQGRRTHCGAGAGDACRTRPLRRRERAALPEPRAARNGAASPITLELGPGRDWPPTEPAATPPRTPTYEGCGPPCKPSR